METFGGDVKILEDYKRLCPGWQGAVRRSGALRRAGWYEDGVATAVILPAPPPRLPTRGHGDGNMGNGHDDETVTTVIGDM